MIPREQGVDRQGLAALLEAQAMKGPERSLANPALTPTERSNNEQRAWALRQAAAELRKVCARCQHFRMIRTDSAACDAVRNGGIFAAVPLDGSGGCSHNFKPRTAAPEGE